jgi:16S rRNA (cytidine1402-2'-O)-methyltransferase
MTSKTYHIGPYLHDAPALAPALYLVATPIGNLGDISLRALQVLAAADYIYCEDTRVTAKLLERYGIRTTMRNYHEHNAASVRPDMIAALHGGKAIALVSDAGTPLISDPGFKLVEACAAENIMVTALPGASAVLTGLQLSALPTDRFSFLGFMPEKKTARLKFLHAYKSHPLTAIVYESPHRVLDALLDMASVLGERPVAAARELTKLHEEVLRGTAASIHAALSARASVRGEFVLVIAQDLAKDQPADELTIDMAITTALETFSTAQAAKLVARQLNLARDDVYQRILKRKDSEKDDADD